VILQSRGDPLLSVPDPVSTAPSFSHAVLLLMQLLLLLLMSLLFKAEDEQGGRLRMAKLRTRDKF